LKKGNNRNRKIYVG